MKIGLTADSSSGLAYAPFEHQAEITKTTIHFDEETLIDGVDITADDFYLRLENTKVIPTTSAPTTGEVLAAVLKLKEKGCTDVIHFPISTNLSAYGKNLAALIKPHLEGINFHVLDTKTATLMQGYLVKVAEKLALLGHTVDEIKTTLLALRKQMNAYFIVDDLRYLMKSGRLSNLSGTLGILAKIKPILNLNQDGKIVTKEKVRIHKKAVGRLYDLILEETKDAKRVVIMILHTNRLEDATILAHRFKQAMPQLDELLISTITPTVGAHIGSQILGAGYIIKDGFEELD